MRSYPDGWANVRLAEIAVVCSGIGFPNAYQGQISGDLPFFKVSDISAAVLRNFGVLEKAGNYVSKEVAALLKGRPIAVGATVFAKIGEAIHLNRRAITACQCLVDNNVMTVKAIDDISDRYVYQFLRTVDFGDNARSTTVPSLRKGDVEELDFPLAPVNEQRRIADKLDTVLTRVDAVQDRLARITPLLKRFRQSILAAAISGRLTNDWRSEDCSLIWIESTLGLAAINKNSLRVPISEILRKGRKGVYPYYGASGVIDGIDGFTHDGEFLLIGEDGANLLSRSKPIAFRATGKIWVNNHAHVLSSDNSDKLDFLSFFVNSIDLKPWVTGSAQPKLTRKALDSIPIRVPPDEEQTEIVRRVELLMGYADRLEARLKAAQTAADRLTPALLAKAFRGELVPQDPNDEPASELLRRLREARASEGVKKPRRASRSGARARSFTPEEKPEERQRSGSAGVVAAGARTAERA